MSVITKRGDSGETDLMYGRRVAKTHPRIIANGAIDELNAILGLARWHTRLDAADVEREIGELQAQLVLIMGQVATASEDCERYEKDGFQTISDAATRKLTDAAQKLESDLKARFKDWAIPGSSGPLASAHLDHARTVCRRAERHLIEITDGGDVLSEPTIFLNRLSDYLWLLARALERR